MLNVRGAIFVHVGAYFRIRENESGVENVEVQIICKYKYTKSNINMRL